MPGLAFLRTTWSSAGIDNNYSASTIGGPATGDETTRRMRVLQEVNWMYAFVTVTSFLLILPFLLGYDLGLENSPLQDSITNSQSLKIVSAIGIGVSIPIFIDTVTSSTRTPFYLFRLALIILFDIPFVWIAFGLQFNNSTCLYACFSLVSLDFLMGIAYIVIYKQHFNIISKYYVWGLILISLSAMVVELTYTAKSGGILTVLRFCTRGVTYAGVWILGFILLRNLYLDFKLSELGFSEWYDKKASVDDLVTASLILIVTGYILVNFIAGCAMNNLDGFYHGNPGILILNSISKSAVTILIALFPGRILQAAATKLRIDFDNKISVVRYIRCCTSSYLSWSIAFSG